MGRAIEVSGLRKRYGHKLAVAGISFAVGPLARFGYVAKLRAGRHPERDDVLYVRGSSVSVTGQAFWCSADGELYGPERRRTWRIEPAAFRMPLPPR